MKIRRQLVSVITTIMLVFTLGVGSAFAEEATYEVSVTEKLGTETLNVPIYDWEADAAVEQELEMIFVPDGAVLSLSTDFDLGAVVTTYGLYDGVYMEDGPVYWTVGGQLSGYNYLEAGTTGTVVLEHQDYIEFYELHIWQEGYEKSWYFAVIPDAGSNGQPAAEAPAETPAVKAIPTPSVVLVDGERVDFEAYNIDGSNYFKLRDIAAALNGTLSQFSVGWDAEANAISLTSGEEYTFAGGELTKSGNASGKTGVPSNSVIYLDGEPVDLTAYNIDGNNYFKLRDLARALNFGVGWDAATSTITIDSTADYEE
jgi:hypothetical protein